jgi:hypothetical protein
MRPTFGFAFRPGERAGDTPEYSLYVGTGADHVSSLLGLGRKSGRTARLSRRGRRAVLAGTAVMGAAAGGVATGVVATSGVAAVAVLRRRRQRRSSSAT